MTFCLTYRVLGNFEDSYKLINACMLLLIWLVSSIQKCQKKVLDAAQVPEYSTTIGNCVECLEAVRANEAMLALLHLSAVDDPGSKTYGIPVQITIIIYKFHYISSFGFADQLRSLKESATNLKRQLRSYKSVHLNYERVTKSLAFIDR